MAVAVQFAIGGITMVTRPNDALIVQLCGIEALPVAGDQCVARRMWKGGRHARLRTTQIYLHVSDPQVQADYEAAMAEVKRMLRPGGNSP